MFICICNAVTESAIATAAAGGARTVEDLAFQLGVGAGCGGCREAADGVLKECLRSRRGAGHMKVICQRVQGAA